MSKHILSVNRIANEDSNQLKNLLLLISSIVKRISKDTYKHSKASWSWPKESEHCDHRQNGTDTDGKNGLEEVSG